MAEDPNLNGLNDAAKANPTEEKVETQEIKSSEKPVGEVALGAIDALDLTAEQKSQLVDGAVDRALSFKPIPMKSAALLSAAAQVKKDANGINVWLSARSRVAMQLDKLLSQGINKVHGSAEVKEGIVNSILLQRNFELRMQEANQLSTQQLSISKNILDFNTTTATTYMKNSLSLQYRQLFATKDLITLTKAFADMAENKLDAIKINTQLPEEKKTSFADIIKDKIRKTIISKGSKFAIDFLAKETPEDARAHILGVKNQALDYIKKIKEFVKPQTMDSANPSEPAGPTVPLGARIKAALQPEAIWQNSKMPREAIAEMIKKVTETEKSPEALLSGILAEIQKGNLASRPPGEHPAFSMASDASAVASEQFTSMTKSLSGIYGSLEGLKSQYTKNAINQNSNFERLYALVSNINAVLMHQHIADAGPGGFQADPATPSSGLPPSSKYTGSPGTMPGAIADMLKEVVNKHAPKRKGVHKITDSLLYGVGSITKGTVSAAAAMPKLYKSIVGFGANAVTSTGKFVFKNRDKSPYADVYVKGDIKPGRPIVSEKQFRKGLIFADGTRVLNVNKIDQPVLDPITGQTLITEDDLKAGIVDVFGEPIVKRSARFSMIGGIFNVAKFGIKGAASVAKPLLSMYAEIAKLIPKTLIGVGSLVSKSIVGILSGKAPGAIAKTLGSVTASFTKMYANMFGFGLKTISSVGGTLFGRLLGFNTKGSFKKKDIYDLITVRLDNIYSLLKERMVDGNIRPGSFQDHEAREKRDEENLVHLRNQEETSPGSGGYLGKLAKLFGVGGGAAAAGSAIADPDSGDGVDSPDKNADGDNTSSGGTSSGGGIWNNIKSGAESIGGAFAAKKLARFIPGKNLLGKIIPGMKSAGKAGATVAADVAHDSEDILKGGSKSLISKIASSGGIKAILTLGKKIGLDNVLKLGGKDLLKKIPGLSVLAGTAFAVDDIHHGDYVAAAGDEASGLLSMVPGIGTAASVAVDSWLAYRQFHKAGASGAATFQQTRLKSYGVNASKQKIIDSLEARTLQIVITNGKTRFSDAELKDYAKQFGFNPSDTGQYQYFCEWLDNRFRECYLCYLVVLKKHNYNLTTGDVGVRAKDQAKLIAEFTSDIALTLQKYSNLIPTMVGYNASPAAMAARMNSTPQTVTPQPKTPTSSSGPNALPIINASYTSSNYNGTAQTQELTYGPSNANDNVNGSASIPGSSASGISNPAAAMVAAGGSWNSIVPGTVNSAPAQPITSALTHQRAIQAVNYFMKCGWTKEQACGMVGSLMRESQLNTTAVGDGGAALGIAQWHSDRYGPILQALYPGKQMQDLTFEQQLAAVQWELTGPEKRAAQMLKSAKDPRTAGAYASKYYERPANTNGEMAVRAGLAAGVYMAYNGSPNAAKQQLASTPTQVASVTQPTSTSPASTTDTNAGGGQAPAQTASATPPSGGTPSFGGGNTDQAAASPAGFTDTAYQQTASAPPNMPYNPSPIPSEQFPQYRYPSQGPGMSIMDPIRTAVMDVNNIKDTFTAFKNLGKENRGYQQQPLSVQVTPHPDMIAAAQEQSGASRKSLSVLGDISATLAGLHQHLQQVHSEGGLFGTMADNIATQAKQPGGASLFAPIIHAPGKGPECKDDVGFGVSKKRDARYAA